MTKIKISSSLFIQYITCTMYFLDSIFFYLWKYFFCGSFLKIKNLIVIEVNPVLLCNALEIIIIYFLTRHLQRKLSLYICML